MSITTSVTPFLRCATASTPCAVSTRVAPRSLHTCRNTAAGSGFVSAVTTRMPGLITPAFSNAMSDNVDPRCCWWSRSIDGMAAATGVTTFVASNRPPIPTSSTATSIPDCRNSDSAMAVVASKKVGGVSNRPSRTRSSITWRSCSASRASASGETGSPSTANRSSSDVRWGEVKRPVRYPVARSAVSSIAATDPLPLVPATMIDEKERSGCPNASHKSRIFSSPSLIPNCWRLKRKSIGSGKIGLRGVLRERLG